MWDLDFNEVFRIVAFIKEHIDKHYPLPCTMVTRTDWETIACSRWALNELINRIYASSDRLPYCFSTALHRDEFEDIVRWFIAELEELDIADKCINNKWPVAQEALENILNDWIDERSEIYECL